MTSGKIHLAAFCLAIAALSGPAAGQGKNSASNPQAAARQVLDELALRELRRSPEWREQLGATNVRNVRRGDEVLDDRSPAAFERARIDWIEGLTQLEALPDSTSDIRDVEIARFAYRSLVELSAFGYGRIDLGVARPYAVDHMQGAYLDLVDLLGERTNMRQPGDIDRWLERLEGVDEAIEQDIRRLRFDARMGVVPPPSVLVLMREAALPFAGGDLAAHPFVQLLDGHLATLPTATEGQKSAARAEALRIVEDEVQPAYRRFIAEVDRLAATPGTGPGMWALPDGEEFYAEIVGFYTSTDMTPETAHVLGRDVVAEIEAALEIELAAIGLTEGTVGERLALLSARPDQIYPDTDEGRRALIAEARFDLDKASAIMGDVLEGANGTPIAIVPVPVYLQASAPSAYYRPASIDGSRPGYLYINLRDTAEWPAYTLPTLIYHEALPGHHADAAYKRDYRNRAMITRMIWSSGYTEGWATYAEDLADEFGLFADDPLARIGYLQSVLFRAVRLVVDTGLHDRRWSREEAIDYLVAKTGLPRSMMESEVDRYLVWPGQALTYIVGREEIRELRTQAERVLGDDFDLKAFHNAILAGGPRPLELVAEDVLAWQASVIRARGDQAR